MPPDIRISQEPGIIRIVYQGKPEPAITTRMLREVGERVAQTGCERLLFDVRNADLSDVYIDAIRHTEEAEQLGIHRALRIAVLGRPDPVLPYLENVTVNRGYQVKAFTDETLALAWLRL